MNISKKFVREKYRQAVNKRNSRRLRNTNFSILTASCIGGVIYHNLGLKFLSPTINMWFSPKDLIKFCLDLDYYLCESLDFSAPHHSDCPDSPAAYLGKGERRIELYFNHYKTEEDAAEKWEKRKSRINTENIYIITTDYEMDSDTISLIEKVPCKRIVVFTSRKRDDIPYSFELKSLHGDKDADLHMVKKNSITRFWTWEHEFDYVAWLNGNRKFRKSNVWNILDKLKRMV